MTLGIFGEILPQIYHILNDQITLVVNLKQPISYLKKLCIVYI